MKARRTVRGNAFLTSEGTQVHRLLHGREHCHPIGELAGISFRMQLIKSIFYKVTQQMEVLLNQNYPSSKPQESQGQHPCFDCEHVGVDALPDIKALPTSQAASTVRFIQIPFP